MVPAERAGREAAIPSVVLEARQLCKRYGAATAVDSIDLAICTGEVLAVIGDNGAGKSTLVNMLSGAIRPDSGAIILRGETVNFSDPHEARTSGVEIVRQDLGLSDVLDVAGNLFLGRELVHHMPLLPRSLRALNRREMTRRSRERFDGLGLTLPTVSNQSVARLSGGQRQAVAIARGAAWASEVLFMDEPTAALGVQQSTMVLELLRRLARDGLAIVLITHTLPFVMEYADRIVVLRRGRKVADILPAQTTPEKLVSLIVGFDYADRP